MAGMNRARVWWSPGLGLWLAHYKIPNGYLGPIITANGLTAADAFINLQTLYRRHAESQRNAQATERAPAGRDPDAAGEGGLQRPAARDEAFNCPCGCGHTLVVNFGRQRASWFRHGYAYDWHRKTGSSAPGEASAISARSGPGRADDQDRAYFVGPDYFTVHHNDDGMRVYSWAETDTEIEASEDQAPGRPPPCS